MYLLLQKVSSFCLPL